MNSSDPIVWRTPVGAFQTLKQALDWIDGDGKKLGFPLKVQKRATSTMFTVVDAREPDPGKAATEKVPNRELSFSENTFGIGAPLRGYAA